MFHSQFINTPHASPEINSGELLVETAGYVSAERRITEMIAAGHRLSDYRKENYDTEDSDEDIPIFPVRRPGFDMAEASMMLQDVETRKIRKGERKRPLQPTPDQVDQPLTVTPPPVKGG
nr:MAG: hypothetical protein [Microviridae sp.]